MNTTITTILAVTITLVLSISKPGFAQQTATPSATHKLTVVIPDVSTRNGKLYVGLANDRASFDGESIQNKIIDVPATGPVTVTFDSLATGRYAVRMYQDLNANAKMDFSGQMPAEPFGLSNVVMLMGPPTFDQCSFELAENKTIEVKLMSM